MKYHLIVVHPFGSYAKGQRITDKAEVGKLLGGHHEPRVVKIAAPDDEAQPEDQTVE